MKLRNSYSIQAINPFILSNFSLSPLARQVSSQLETFLGIPRNVFPTSSFWLLPLQHCRRPNSARKDAEENQEPRKNSVQGCWWVDFWAQRYNRLLSPPVRTPQRCTYVIPPSTNRTSFAFATAIHIQYKRFAFFFIFFLLFLPFEPQQQRVLGLREERPCPVHTEVGARRDDIEQEATASRAHKLEDHSDARRAHGRYQRSGNDRERCKYARHI